MSFSSSHFAHWPPGLPHHLTLPQTHLFDNAEVSAQRCPDKPFIVDHDNAPTFAELRREAERVAGFLQRDCGVRAGDLGYVDAEGSFVMANRVKRMINAAGHEVWPAAVEALMYHHPAIEEVCVTGAHDARRGEAVKAMVVLKAGSRGKVNEQQIIDWAHGIMAAFKCPCIVGFVESLPRSGVGKVLWRVPQEQQAARDARAGG